VRRTQQAIEVAAQLQQQLQMPSLISNHSHLVNVLGNVCPAAVSHHAPPRLLRIQPHTLRDVVPAAAAATHITCVNHSNASNLTQHSRWLLMLLLLGSSHEE
jgi:hypothetical protein